MTGGSPAAVLLRDLHKTFDGVGALRGVDLEVRPGEMFGLIGPDGGGKTTALRVLSGLCRPDRGEVLLLGRNPFRERRETQRLLGYMPQRFSLYPDLSVSENLRFFAGLFAVPRRETEKREGELLAFARLERFRGRKARDLSGGMKQKLALACTLIHEPRVLVLDEPTTGVDPVSRGEFWEILRRLIGGGSSILVTTPYMDEAERCDRIALLHRGLVLETGAPAEVAARFPHRLFEVRGAPVYPASRALRETGEFLEVTPFGDSFRVTAREEDGGERIAAALDRLGFRGARVAPARPDVEDLFLARTEGGA
ncbi:MAG: ABC transporter ATP-binding protein [Candidatus Eisenbacteria bacterium]